MNNFKEGKMVKAWSKDFNEYEIGLFILYEEEQEHPFCVDIGGYPCFFINAIPLPDEVVKQLDNLGV